MPEKSSKSANDALHAFVLLKGDEGVDWCYYETDPNWWGLRLWTRRN